MAHDLASLIAEAVRRFEALSPEQQDGMMRAQRESWVRGEMAIGLDRDEASERARSAAAPVAVRA